MQTNPPYTEIIDIRGSKVLQMIDPNDNSRTRYQYLARHPNLLYRRQLPAVEHGDVWRGEAHPRPWEQSAPRDVPTTGPVRDYIDWASLAYCEVNMVECIGGPVPGPDGKPTFTEDEQNYGGEGPEPVRIYPMLPVQTHEYWPSVTSVACPCGDPNGWVAWAEAGWVPGYRICTKCGQHFMASGDASDPSLTELIGRKD